MDLKDLKIEDSKMEELLLKECKERRRRILIKLFVGKDIQSVGILIDGMVNLNERNYFNWIEDIVDDYIKICNYQFQKYKIKEENEVHKALCHYYKMDGFIY